MKRTLVIVTLVVAAQGSGRAGAQVLPLRGSSTLFTVTQSILANCPASTGITFHGTGSSSGENAMAANPATQQIAPMARKVGCSKMSAFPAAQAKVLGFDGIVVAASQCSGEPALGLCQSFTPSASTPLPEGYVWRAGTDDGAYPVACDLIRVLYFGRDHNNVTNCNSSTRQALVNNWGNLFEGPQTGSCTQLNHAFRLDDLSGTADLLRSTCGLHSWVSYCNGTSTQDNDPIRRPAPAANYDIARADGTLGLVLPISVPPVANAYTPGAPSSDTCGPGGVANQGGTRCPFGTFSFRSYPGFGNCPGGRPRRGGLCLIPTTPSTFQVGVGSTNVPCVNSQTNLPPASATGTDGRIFNRQPRNFDSTVVAGLVSAFYRLHESRTVAGGGCKERSSTRQVGCLVRADKCSVGYVGREVLGMPAAASVQLASASGVCTGPNASAIISSTYPLSRRLYLSSLKGFAAVTGEEADLSTCFHDEAKVEAAISAASFIPDPAPGIQTEIFSSSNCFADPPPDPPDSGD